MMHFLGFISVISRGDLFACCLNLHSNTRFDLFALFFTLESSSSPFTRGL